MQNHQVPKIAFGGTFGAAGLQQMPQMSHKNVAVSWQPTASSTRSVSTHSTHTSPRGSPGTSGTTSPIQPFPPLWRPSAQTDVHGKGGSMEQTSVANGSPRVPVVPKAVKTHVGPTAHTAAEADKTHVAPAAHTAAEADSKQSKGCPSKAARSLVLHLMSDKFWHGSGSSGPPEQEFRTPQRSRSDNTLGAQSQRTVNIWGNAREADSLVDSLPSTALGNFSSRSSKSLDGLDVTIPVASASEVQRVLSGSPSKGHSGEEGVGKLKDKQSGSPSKGEQQSSANDKSALDRERTTSSAGPLPKVNRASAPQYSGRRRLSLRRSSSSPPGKASGKGDWPRGTSPINVYATEAAGQSDASLRKGVSEMIDEVQKLIDSSSESRLQTEDESDSLLNGNSIEMREDFLRRKQNLLNLLTEAECRTQNAVAEEAEPADPPFAKLESPNCSAERTAEFGFGSDTVEVFAEVPKILVGVPSKSIKKMVGDNSGRWPSAEVSGRDTAEVLRSCPLTAIRPVGASEQVERTPDVPIARDVCLSTNETTSTPNSLQQETPDKRLEPVQRGSNSWMFNSVPAPPPAANCSLDTTVQVVDPLPSPIQITPIGFCPVDSVVTPMQGPYSGCNDDSFSSAVLASGSPSLGRFKRLHSPPPRFPRDHFESPARTSRNSTPVRSTPSRRPGSTGALARRPGPSGPRFNREPLVTPASVTDRKGGQFTLVTPSDQFPLVTPSADTGSKGGQFESPPQWNVATLRRSLTPPGKSVGPQMSRLTPSSSAAVPDIIPAPKPKRTCSGRPLTNRAWGEPLQIQAEKLALDLLSRDADRSQRPASADRSATRHCSNLTQPTERKATPVKVCLESTFSIHHHLEDQSMQRSQSTQRSQSRQRRAKKRAGSGDGRFVKIASAKAQPGAPVPRTTINLF